MLALGSSFGADRLGWLAVQEAEAVLQARGAEVRRCAQPAEVLAALDGAGAAIIVDALDAPALQGRIVRLSLAELEVAAPRRSSHAAGLGELLALGARLDMLPPTLLIFGIGVDGGRPLSGGAARQTARRAARTLRAAVDEILAAPDRFPPHRHASNN